MKDHDSGLQESAKKIKDMALLYYSYAVLHAEKGNLHVAEGFARECLALLTKISTDTLDDCCSHIIELNGVNIPEIFHEKVVIENMKRYRIDLSDLSPKAEKGGDS